jgi:iron complex transport system substrate-binding protein
MMRASERSAMRDGVRSDVDHVTAPVAAGMGFPSRVVCLTEEPVETLYAIGAGDVVIGISGFVTRPPEARKKPKVSTYLDASYDEIVALAPDLVIGFSDLQADIARELVKRGLPVVIFNQRSIAEILTTVRMTAALVGRAADGVALAATLARGLDDYGARAAARTTKPRVFLEEWPDPLISGIRWTSELVERLGGVDIFDETRASHDAQGRIVDAAAVGARAPDVIIASWCGKRVDVDKDVIRRRPGFADIPAVKNGHVYEVDSDILLQPGPAVLTDGARALSAILDRVVDGAPIPDGLGVR